MEEEPAVRRTKDEDDPRLELISFYTLATFRLKHEKWHKMITTEDYKVSVNILYVYEIIEIEENRDIKKSITNFLIF